VTPAEALEELWSMLQLDYDSKIERAWAARKVLLAALGLPPDEGE